MHVDRRFPGGVSVVASIAREAGRELSVSLVLFTNITRYVQMADPKGKGAAARARFVSQRNGTNNWQPSEFININLNEQEDVDKAEAIPNYDTLLALLTEEVENGYKFTLKWDERGNCMSVFMQNTDVEHENGGLILTGRGGTAASALRECIYCHRNILQGEWARANSRKRGPEDAF